MLCVNICVCVSLCSSPQHCLSRTSPCMWQCQYPIRMPCTRREGIWAARPWQQPQARWVRVGCCPLRRPLCTGMLALVEALRGPQVQAVQVSGQTICQSGGWIADGGLQYLLWCIHIYIYIYTHCSCAKIRQLLTFLLSWEDGSVK